MDAVADAWTSPERALDLAAEVLQAPIGQLLAATSQAVAGLVPHRLAAVLDGDCARSPVKTHGDAGLASAVTSSELAALASLTVPGIPWSGAVAIAASVRPVLAVASTPRGATGGLLVLVGVGDTADREAGLVQRLWQLVGVNMAHRVTDAVPGHAAQSRAAASERARAGAELADAHAAALTALLGPLRATGLDDATARAKATEIAVSALVDLKSGRALERELTEEGSAAAFARLTDALTPLLRYSGVRLDLGPPGNERFVPADAAHGARSAVRATVLALLDGGDVTRLHIGWDTKGEELRVTVRSDGQGTLNADAFSLHRVTERLAVLGGRLEVDAVPGWGTTVTATVPVGPVSAPADPMATLHPRELDVLEQLARGRRNRAIAEALHISESTVKFHVANILGKLSVSARGEAAALARDAGIGLGPTRAAG